MAYSPGHYYSPVANLTEVKNRQQQLFASPASLPGIDLNVDGQLARIPEFRALFMDQPFSDEAAKGLRYQFVNPFFSYGDGLAYYCMLRSLQPRRVIEIGSGWSGSSVGRG